MLIATECRNVIEPILPHRLLAGVVYGGQEALLPCCVLAPLRENKAELALVVV